ncbi:MAG: hypothetical protein QXH24_02745 [Candidatus Bathyarchaeia archaeon]
MSNSSISGHEKIKIYYTEYAREAMKQMQVSDEQVRKVIYYGEKSGEKLYAQGEERFLAKMETDEITICAEYSPSEEKDTYVVHTVYAYKVKIKV